MYRRPIVAITIAFIIGIIIQYYLRLPIKIILGAITVNLMFLVTSIYKKSKLIILSLALFIILFGNLNLEYSYITENPIKTFTNKNVEIIGDCIQNDITDESMYILNINRIIYNGKTYKLNDKTLLKIFKYEGKSLHNKKIKVEGKLKTPDTARNPKMFNYNLYLRTQGIHTIINTNHNSIEVVNTGALHPLIKLRHRIKSYIYNSTFNNFPGTEGRVALSIAFGDRKLLDEDLYEAFKTSGTAHALAVSGLHFGILFLFINSILKIFKLREKHKTFILVFLIWGFAFIVGFTPSVIRASSMITLFAISNLFDRKYDLFTSLAFISLMTTALNPFMIFSISFQLSFLAVLSIGLFYRPIYEKLYFFPDFIRKMITTTLSAQIGTAPLIAYHFNIVSPIGILLNIPVVLLVSIILPISLIFFIMLFINNSIAGFIASIDKLIIKLMMWINSLSLYLPLSKLKVISPSWAFILTFYGSLLLIFYKAKIPYVKNFKIKDIAIIFLFVILIGSSINLIYPRKLRVTFLDVGQGDCILVQTPKGKTVLIDGGENKNDFLSEFLLKNRIAYIDLICVTHIHNDHIGGISDVVENIKTDALAIGTKEYSSEELKEIEKQCNIKNIPIIEFSKGKSIKLEKDVTLTSIHPSKKLMKNTNDDTNNNSLVFILEYKDFEVLLTGDIEKEAEMDIIREGNKRDIDVLKVGHHGSNTSSTSAMLDFFKPKIAVIQVGKNVFGHPHKDTLDKLNERDIKIYRNDKNGAVIIKTNGENIQVKTMLD